jgi:hypothetical protein
MISGRARLLSAVLAMSFPAQPIMALGTMPAPAAIVTSFTVQTCAEQTTAFASRGVSTSFFPIAFVPLAALAPAMLEEQRSTVAAQLVNLGYAADVAEALAGELTGDDLDVLLANPKMMQQAGHISPVVWALIIAGVIVAVAAVATTSSIHVH